MVQDGHLVLAGDGGEDGVGHGNAGEAVEQGPVDGRFDKNDLDAFGGRVLDEAVKQVCLLAVVDCLGMYKLSL